MFKAYSFRVSRERATTVVMRMLAALVVLASSMHAADEPTLHNVLTRLGLYSSAYQKNFRDFVATEERTQRHWGPGGKLEQRSTVSDYYVVSLPRDPDSLVEFRETHSVDGRPVKPARKPRNIAAENRRYDIGAFRKFEEYTNMGLLYLDPQVQREVTYELAPPVSNNVFVLRFRERGPDTVARMDGHPAPATGTVQFTWPDVRVVQVDFAIHEEDGFPYVRCVIDYAPGPGGVMVPVRSRHFIPGMIDAPAPGAWQSDASYTNYRRFSSDVKLTIEGAVVR